MILELNGMYAGLRFSSAHIVFGHDSCGVIHGHSYYVDVKVCGAPSGEFGFVCDFKILKKIVKNICGKLDHKLLIPENHPNLKYNIENNAINFTFCKGDKIKEYKIPLEDVVLLPILSTTAEELSKYFAEHIKMELCTLNLENSIDWIEATVNEGIGQGATYRAILKK
ncbi:6-carboxytetrahydropterin synthase QueD [Methanothermococcus okinawensis]|uniref:6-pyruvoyltetrahydropterin synthase n=1 Tax=Methanothermococcus okinawensis (strain DSM 14208 / JCM 11175 / IH1) TaxID=647113 RepID=F8AMF0_METOI|nr:6-carboxytetrahydropterin synthase QueD [Methanothermococcus okinawensis]AEH06846.1 6-pyruvoyltetrahydropterin synthase [Methanothermococcus okinawensis IH1]